MLIFHQASRSILAGGAALALTVAAGAAMAGDAPKVVELTQTGCQFVESENGVDHGFKTTKKADCEAINEQTGEERLAKAKVLELEPGKYIFRVTNKNVPYELGFWLRGKGVGRVTLPSVSGPGLKPGVTQDYAVELKPGDYYYSCPLNTTPDYSIKVKG